MGMYCLSGVVCGARVMRASLCVGVLEAYG